MPSYKLVYFNFRGRAEAARWIFELAGQEYEDFRFNREDWPKHKAGTPFGQAPVLEVDGKQLCQSAAICRYLANQFGFAGKDPWEKGQADQYVDCVEDILKGFQKVHFSPEDQKAEAKKTFFEGIVANTLSKFDQIIGENESGFLVGSKITWADIAVSAWMNNMELMLKEEMTQAIDSYPNVRRLITRVLKLPKIAAWLDKRPKTEF